MYIKTDYSINTQLRFKTQGQQNSLFEKTKVKSLMKSRGNLENNGIVYFWLNHSFKQDDFLVSKCYISLPETRVELGKVKFSRLTQPSIKASTLIACECWHKNEQNSSTFTRCKLNKKQTTEYVKSVDIRTSHWPCLTLQKSEKRVKMLAPSERKALPK